MQICGVQDQTGATTRRIFIEPADDDDSEMTPAPARELAAALLAAVSEIGRITEAEDKL